MKVVVTCAGTGGHIVPAIAIANIIKEKYPETEFLFIGTEKGMENDLVTKAGYEIKSIRTGKLIRKITLENFKQMRNARLGVNDAKRILKTFKPDLVIGTGGYICMSVMRAAKLLNIKYILHESNAFPGLSVKILARYAYRVLLGFEEAKERLNTLENVVVTGNVSKITKEEYEKLDKDECKKELGLKDVNSKIVFVTFGSQGAKYLNEYIIELAKRQNNNYYFILVTGNNNYDEVMEKVRESEKQLNIDLTKFLKVEKFVYEMDKMYKVSDICITRAGAMTINELEIVKVPAVLIPLPTAAENHQYYNAKVLENVGAASIIEQKDLSVDRLISKLLEMSDARVYNRYKGSYDKLKENNAKEKIANEIRIFKNAYVKE